jgi:hypothetical protein
MVVEGNPQKTVKQSIEYINKEAIKGPRDETGVIAETTRHRNRKPRERIGDAVSSSRTSVEAIRDKVRHLELNERAMMISVLQEYFDLFGDEAGRLTSRCTRQGYHEIRTGDALTIKKNAYRVRYALRDEMKRQLDDMLAKGVITSCAVSHPSYFSTQKVDRWHTQILVLYRFQSIKFSDTNPSISSSGY